MEIIGALVLFALVLGGCYASSLPKLSLHPAVILDDTFSDAEQLWIAAGLALWETAGVGVAFAVSTMPRDALLMAAQSTDRYNTIYVVRNEGNDDPSCPLSTIGESHLATTRRIVPADGIEILCLDAPLCTRLDAWDVTVAHEIGHCLGLEHETSGARSIMAPTLEAASRRVEDVDRAQLLRVWAGR